MRIVGIILVIFGLLISLSIVGAIIGGPMVLIGLVMIMAGGRRKTIITNVVQVSNTTAGRPEELGRLSEAPFNRVQIGREPEPQYIPPPVYRPAAYSGGGSVMERLDRPADAPAVFHDIEHEISEESLGILRKAKADGYHVKYFRNENKVLARLPNEPEVVLFSNGDIRDFGRARGYRAER